jgi:hypothetical protein
MLLGSRFDSIIEKLAILSFLWLGLTIRFKDSKLFENCFIAKINNINH